MNELCKGCSVAPECDAYIMDSNYITFCPCSKCLIKVVCNMPCKVYLKFIGKTYRDKEFIEKMKEQGLSLLIADKKNIMREIRR